MAYCLPRAFASEFLKALRSGKIQPDKLMEMTSEERRAFFEPIVGADNAPHVNALFESKLLLPDQMAGLVDWAKSLSGIKEPVRRDLLSRIGRMKNVLTPSDEHGFLADLAAQKLGTGVTEEEAAHIVSASKLVDELRGGWDEDSQKWSSDDARLQYGAAYVEFQDYVGHLKSGAKAMTFKEFLTSPSKWWGTVGGVTKGVVASMDNSYFGRQGLKMMLTNPDIWGSSFLKSWGDFGNALVKVDAMKAIKADVFSRPNAMNGKYQAGGYALGLDSEEAFPSHLPERIPLLGRVYKGSEVAFNGAALRMRSAYADRIIQKADEMGVDTTDPVQAEGLGSLVNSMTGRGDLTVSKDTADFINSAFFSMRFLKANFDTLTMHRLGYGFGKEAGPGRDFARKQAAMNLLKILGGIGVMLATASVMWPGSVDPDPRSTNFGKIKIGDTRFDVTGGMGSLVTLAARLIPTMHNGQWGEWSKSSTSGRFTDLRSGKYGQETAMDVIDAFWQGKLSPIAGIFRDTFKGTVYGGAKATPENMIGNLVTPMPMQTFMDAYKDPHAANLWAIMIADGLGISTNTYPIKRAANH